MVQCIRIPVPNAGDMDSILVGRSHMLHSQKSKEDMDFIQELWGKRVAESELCFRSKIFIITIIIIIVAMIDKVYGAFIVCWALF